MMINPGVTDIQNKRRKLLEGLDANEGFEQGLRESAIDQYAGKCHFIYELLQNAGDAGATEVEFTLSREALEFRHNGTRLFRIEDVNSITNYHQSTKKGEDYEAVGKFGMGFKSVFFYTTSPEIHSGEYHFRIDRMFYPETSDVRVDEALNGWTKFIFPFRHDSRSAAEIFEEVRQGLVQIRGETLLFLRHIRKIECLFENGTYLSIVRDENAEHIVRIKRVSDSGKTSGAYYLKFTKTIRLPDDTQELDIAIAYGLENDPSYLMSGDMEGLSPRCFTIRPLRGKVFVYFPAEKELSNLQFHINAPFATPMSRESLTENADNEKLLRELAKLTVESLPFLRDNGLLKTETLAVFPIDKDQLPSKYGVFETDIVTAFNTQDLTPTKSGSFKRADQLIRSENRMSDLFTDEDMTKIYRQYQTPVWVKAPMVHTREDEFLSALDLQTFGDDDLSELVQDDSDESIGFFRLITCFDDKRLLSLYKKVAELHIPPKSRIGGWNIGSIFRATDGNLYPAHQLYFDAGIGQPDDDAATCHFLKRIYRDGDTALISFFKDNGVKEFSVENVLRAKFRQEVRDRCDNATIERHIEWTRLLIQAHKTNPSVAKRFPDFTWLCKECESTSVLRLALAKDIIIDHPYEETGMSTIRNECRKFILSKIYVERFDDDDLNTFRKILADYDFVRDIGVNYMEEHHYFSLWQHPRRSELELPPGCRQRDPWYRDCQINNLDYLIGCINDEISRRLWNLLISLHCSGSFKNPFKATCRHSASCMKQADSLLVCSLQEKAWIKGIDNQWHKPADVTFNSLHSMYEHRETCEGLRAVRFGERAGKIEKANLEKRQEVDKFIQSTGAESETEVREAVEQMRLAKQNGIDVWGMILKRQSAAEMPENASGNMERRQQRAREDLSQAENQTREMRERSVRVSSSMEHQARERLERDYTDDAKMMRCQLCHQPMPFDKRDGHPYFECVQLLRDMKKESPDQYLALCPTCRAAYDEWVRKHEANANRLRQEILSRMVKSGQGSISILLPDHGTPACQDSPLRGKSLYFVATHFADLKVVLEGEDT